MKKNHTFAILAYKESPYLEECIKSVMKQNKNSETLIMTQTPNNYISEIAKKYNFYTIECTDNKRIKTIEEIQNELYNYIKDLL